MAAVIDRLSPAKRALARVKVEEVLMELNLTICSVVIFTYYNIVLFILIILISKRRGIFSLMPRFFEHVLPATAQIPHQT